MPNQTIQPIHNNQKATMFFDRKDVKFDHELGQFTVHVTRFGLDILAVGETPYHARLLASESLARHLGHDVTPYMKRYLGEDYKAQYDG